MKNTILLTNNPDLKNFQNEMDSIIQEQEDEDADENKNSKFLNKWLQIIKFFII